MNTVHTAVRTICTSTSGHKDRYLYEQITESPHLTQTPPTTAHGGLEPSDPLNQLRSTTDCGHSEYLHYSKGNWVWMCEFIAYSTE